MITAEGLMNFITVVVAVAVRGDRILTTLREPNKPFANHWHLPGGKVEANETLEEALMREIDEELDADVKVGEELARVYLKFPWGNFRLHFRRCEINWDGPRPRALWMSRLDLQAAKFIETDRIVAELALREAESLAS